MHLSKSIQKARMFKMSPAAVGVQRRTRNISVVNESLKGSRVISVPLLGFPGRRISVTSDPAPPSQ